MGKKFSRMLYGGDYNPNQWPKEIWKEDMRILKKAYINSATINVFSWAKIQPSEDTFYFDELDEMVEMLEQEGYDIVLATSTGAMPAWMVKRYPEVSRTDYQGRYHKFGQRHNFCPSSEVFKKNASALVEELAKRYAHRSSIVCWHINNEYSGECYCENCERAFRLWLQEKYGTIEELNRAWNLEFWGHTVYEWDEIVAPNGLADGMEDGINTVFSGLSVDYKRFMSDSLLESYKMERDIIRKYNPDALITTNLMGTYKGLDYFKWAKEMDIVSWDNYPTYKTPWSFNALSHDLMRGVKDAPFMLMEQTPSQQNWQPYNALKRPGQMRAQSYQTIAHGADTIQYFQLRRSVGGCEKFHGGVIAYVGHENTRVFREVAQLGEELQRLSGDILNTKNRGQVGMIFDWDNYWAFEYKIGPTVDLTYVDQIERYYNYFYNRNIEVDMVAFDGEFDRYKVIVAPVYYMVKPGSKEKLERFVADGGTLVLTYMSGVTDETDNVCLGGYPGPFREMAGVWVEEIDALAPGCTNPVIFADGTKAEGKIICEIMHEEGAEVLATYGGEFYAGTPAVTKNGCGNGFVYYFGTDLDPVGLAKVLDGAMEEAGVTPVVSGGEGLEITCRRGEGYRLCFVMNFKDEEKSLPAELAGMRDLLTGEIAKTGDVLKKFDVKILKAEE